MTASAQNAQAVSATASDFDVVVVGAGFAGLYMLYRLRKMGFSVRVFEAGSGVGGTWYWNRYPGARCDGESMFYSYQFSEDLQQEWEWTERYAAQPEILRYANHVADRFDLRRDIRFDARVVSAQFDEDTCRWLVETADGTRATARFCVMATGCLSAANRPQFPGLGDFRGEAYHTGEWPHEPVDFSGKRVGVVGTGSSGIQAIPIIARQAAHLYVFQRTPNYAVPAWNGPLSPETIREIKANYAALREKQRSTFTGNMWDVRDQSALEATPEERRREYEARWREGGLGFLAAYRDLLYDDDANATAAEFVRGKIREIVRDPKVAELLCPKYIIGCKRLCVDTGYYETYNRENVTLVDVSATPIKRFTPAGLAVGGREYALDMVVFATGFDAMTGALTRIDIRNGAGERLRDKWRDGPMTYLGLAVAGFPNLFTITGPGSPSVLTNMIPTIEHHVDWIAECLDHLRAKGLRRIAAEPAAEAMWVAHVASVAERSLRPSCNSWYVGANIEGKPRVFMPYFGGMPAYREKCRSVAANGYEGFAAA
ncbi:MAG TPA: NAD(P)/FAD-dependent oxidoreductase [Xanthobacteraceae bacterium]|nr:NAD(P)/FAD-dependent oxidoreductase [Xanthobacteraceae bacterium]